MVAGNLSQLPTLACFETELRIFDRLLEHHSLCGSENRADSTVFRPCARLEGSFTLSSHPPPAGTLNLGHFQVGSYRDRSLIVGLYTL